jgi:hypothetical protein
MTSGRQIKATTLLALALIAFFVVMTTACDREEYDVEASATSPEAGDERGGSLNSDKYAMRVDGADVAVDDAATVNLEILPGSDLKINLDYPWEFEFSEADGVELAEERLRFADLDLTEERAIIPVGVTALEPGRHTVSGKGDFSVCNDDICEIMRGEPVEFVVEAQ